MSIIDKIINKRNRTVVIEGVSFELTLPKGKVVKKLRNRVMEAMIDLQQILPEDDNQDVDTIDKELFTVFNKAQTDLGDIIVECVCACLVEDVELDSVNTMIATKDIDTEELEVTCLQLCGLGALHEQMKMFSAMDVDNLVKEIPEVPLAD